MADVLSTEGVLRNFTYDDFLAFRGEETDVPPVITDITPLTAKNNPSDPMHTMDFVATGTDLRQPSGGVWEWSMGIVPFIANAAALEIPTRLLASLNNNEAPGVYHIQLRNAIEDTIIYTAPRAVTVTAGP